jgi:hypothetical protein
MERPMEDTQKTPLCNDLVEKNWLERAEEWPDMNEQTRRTMPQEDGERSFH